MLRHWFYLIRATAWLLWIFAQARLFYRMRFFSWLQQVTDQAWGPEERRRLLHYYNGTTYLSAVFCCLRGYSLKAGERRVFAQLSALAGLFDDLVDVARHPDALERWQNDPESYGQAADERGLAIRFLHHIKAALPTQRQPLFQTFMLRVFNVEIAGKQQQPSNTPADLAQMTAEKGGCSVLLFRSVLRNGLSPSEETALYQFGYLIQLSDDIFDVWFDLQANINTVATQMLIAQQPLELSQYFERQLENTRNAFRDIDRSSQDTAYTAARIETALRVIHYLAAITRVCLKQYAALALEGPLPLRHRRKMVVDMARRRNWLRAANAILQPV